MDNFNERRAITAALWLALFLSAAAGVFCPTLASAEFQRHYELGKDFLQRQEYKLAIQELNLAATAKATPTEVASALVDRGTAYTELTNYKAAIADFDRAIALDGTSHLAYNNRGVVYFRQGIADQAIANFDKALALDGDDKYAVVNRAGAYLMTDRAASLAPATEKWLKSKKWRSDFAAQAAVLTALAYLAGGDKAHAASLTNEALKSLDKLLWPYPMLSYLAGKSAPEKVVEESQDSTYDLTQAQCFLGFDAYIKGRANYDIAREKLEFVIKHGTTNSVEYWVAKFVLAKIAKPRH
jgi:lipoprotein NlpI